MLFKKRLLISPFNVDCQVGIGARIRIVAFCAGGIGVKLDCPIKLIIVFEADMEINNELR